MPSHKFVRHIVGALDQQSMVHFDNFADFIPWYHDFAIEPKVRSNKVQGLASSMQCAIEVAVRTRILTGHISESLLQFRMECRRRRGGGGRSRRCCCCCCCCCCSDGELRAVLGGRGRHGGYGGRIHTGTRIPAGGVGRGDRCKSTSTSRAGIAGETGRRQR